MDLLTWLIVGLVAGVLASIVMGGSGYGLIGDIVIGILGAFVGGWIFDRLGRGHTVWRTGWHHLRRFYWCARAAPAAARRSPSALSSYYPPHTSLVALKPLAAFRVCC
jgi:uncharacterized membrane protein YeaQ/YmgE (transglycosylase-associated protein family)